jgi:hypothetical protein
MIACLWVGYFGEDIYVGVFLPWECLDKNYVLVDTGPSWLSFLPGPQKGEVKSGQNG